MFRLHSFPESRPEMCGETRDTKALDGVPESWKKGFGEIKLVATADSSQMFFCRM